MARKAEAVGPLNPRVKTTEVKPKRKTLGKITKSPDDVVKDIKGLQYRGGVMKKGLGGLKKGADAKRVVPKAQAKRTNMEAITQALRRRFGMAQ